MVLCRPRFGGNGEQLERVLREAEQDQQRVGVTVSTKQKEMLKLSKPIQF